ncbi:hypothetical protein MY11210_007751 [Beauveria gryllotalpidicola]
MRRLSSSCSASLRLGIIADDAVYNATRASQSATTAPRLRSSHGPSGRCYSWLKMRGTLQGDFPHEVMRTSHGVQLCIPSAALLEDHRTSAKRRGSMLNTDSIAGIIVHFGLQLLNRMKNIIVPL